MDKIIIEILLYVSRYYMTTALAYDGTNYTVKIIGTRGVSIEVSAPKESIDRAPQQFLKSLKNTADTLSEV